jgi:hypothetical protein
MVKELFKEFGLDLAVLFAGFAGSLASITKEKNLSRWQRVVTVAVGGLIAAYMTPIFGNMWSLSEEFKYGIGFVLGYTGLRSMEYILEKYFKKKTPKNSDSETKEK